MPEKREGLRIWGPSERPELETFWSQLLEEPTLLHIPTTPTLYHYTGAAGIQGIVKNQNLRLTDVNYMNDVGELNYAVSLVEKVLEDRRSSTANASDILDTLKQYCNPFRHHFGVFVSCFCESGNLLSQWRSYGFYALGFKTDQVWRVKHHPISTMEWYPAILRKVEYSKEEQCRIIQGVVDRVLELYAHASQTSDQTPYSLLQEYGQYFANIIAEYLLAFKDDIFHEEQEWRIIHYELLSDSKLLEFRTKGDFLVPYLSVPIRSVDDYTLEAHVNGLEQRTGSRSYDADRSNYVDQKGKFPLGEIRIGPSQEAELAKRSLKPFLRQQGFADVKVSRETALLRRPW